MCGMNGDDDEEEVLGMIFENTHKWLIGYCLRLLSIDSRHVCLKTFDYLERIQ